MPLTFKDDAERRQFADRLYYAITTGDRSTADRFDKADPFGKSIDYLKAIAEKEEKDMDGNPMGPAADLMKHLRYSRRLLNVLKAAADYDVQPEDRKVLMEEAQEIMDKMSDTRDADPDTLVSHFYNRYGYGKATDSEMKFISGACHSIRNARCLMSAKELRQEYEDCHDQIQGLKMQGQELVENAKTYMKSMYKVGCTRGTFDTLDAAQTSLVAGYNKTLGDLKDKGYMKEQLSTAKQELQKVEEQYNKYAEPLQKAEKQLKETDDFLKKLQTEKFRKNFEAKEENYEKASAAVQNQKDYIENTRMRIRTQEARVQQSESFRERLNLIEREAPGFSEKLAEYQSWQQRVSALQSAQNSLIELYSQNVNINALLQKKDGYTPEEAEFLDKYDKAKNDIINHLNSDPKEVKKSAELFRTMESEEKNVLDSFFEEYHNTVKDQISRLTERSEDFTEDYGKYVDDYLNIKDQLEQNAFSQELLNNAKKDLAEAEKGLKKLEAAEASAEKEYQKSSQEICTKLGFQGQDVKLTYDIAVDAAKLRHNKLVEQINTLTRSDEFRVLSQKKAAAEKNVESNSSKSVSAKIDAIKKGLKREEEKCRTFASIRQSREDLKNKMAKISEEQVAVQQNHKDLEHKTVQSHLQHTLLGVHTHIMDKSSKERLENRDKNSPEFNAMRDKLDQVFDLLSATGTATAKEKTDALIELGQVAQHYYDEKMKHPVPNIFASEQRHARLECAKNLISLGKIAQQIENEVPACEESVRNFMNANVSMGVGKTFDKNFEKMLDDAYEDMKKKEPDVSVERHKIGEHMKDELDKLEPKNPELENNFN